MPYTLKTKWESRVGYLTYDQMVKTNGEPRHRRMLDNGGFTAEWKMKNFDYHDLAAPYVATDTMVLTFDRKGILQNWDSYR